MRSILTFITLFLFVNSLLAQVPAGYYNSASGLTGSALKQELHDIITSGHSSVGYTPGVWNAFYTTDVYPAPNGTVVWDMYSAISNTYDGSAPYYFTIGTDQDSGSGS
ncbi:MAG: endonuclease I, partial [Salinivirgaceae bacterium]